MIKRKSKIRRLFWDVEITPNLVLAFRTGYDLTINPDAIVKERRLICIGYKWEGDKESTVLRCHPNGDDKSLVLRFLKIASKADELVAHFGDRADLPWLRARALILRLNPLPFFKTVDTKAWASKNFGFNSNKLDHLAQVLGHGGKEKMEFEDWKQITLNNSKKHMDKMCHYCGVDVLKLEKVYQDLAPNVKPKTHVGVLAGGEKWSCPRCGGTDVKKSKTIVSAAGAITHQMRCNSDGSYYRISDKDFRDRAMAINAQKLGIPRTKT